MTRKELQDRIVAVLENGRRTKRQLIGDAKKIIDFVAERCARIAESEIKMQPPSHWEIARIVIASIAKRIRES